MKKFFHSTMVMLSGASSLIALFTLGTTCRLWLYQPSVPAMLREEE